MLRKMLSTMNSFVARCLSAPEIAAIAVGDIVTIKGHVGHVFPGGGSLSVAPMRRGKPGHTYILIDRAEVHEHKKLAA